MTQRWKVLLVTSVAVFMGFLDVTIVNIAFPDIEQSFPDSSLAGLSWILNAYNIVFAALLVPAGRLADRVGRRRMFFVGIGTFLAASAACGLAPSVPFLVGARVVQAAGAAILVPTSLGLLLPEFPLEQRATATALWGATGAIAAATGPSLGGVLVDVAGWRWVFFVNLAIGLPALIPARRLLHERRDEHPGPLPDALGVALLIVGVGLLSLGIVKGEDWGWGSARVIGSLVAAVLALVAFVVRSARHPAPVVELRLFRVRSFAVANVGVFLFALGFYALLLANILFLTGVWGWSVLKAGVAVTPGPLMAAISAAAGGRLADRYGQRVIAVPGGLLFAAGCMLFAATTDATPHYASEILPWQMLTGTGVGLSFAAWGSAAVAELPPSRFATGSAISSTSRQIGAVLGIAILVAVLGTPRPEDAVATFHTAWHLMAIPAATAGLLAIALGRVRARDPEAAAAGAPATAAAATSPACAPRAIAAPDAAAASVEA
jgi:EmrB/QacA subfamily drug resistance transporter